MVYHHRKIVMAYLRGRFFIDFISSAPFHLLTLAVGTKASSVRLVRNHCSSKSVSCQCCSMGHPCHNLKIDASPCVSRLADRPTTLP